MGSATPQHSETLIVGAGVFGTSTAYHLSLTHPSPSNVRVLDRAPFPSPFGASYDVNKIVRADYGVRFYMDLAYEAMDAWANSPIFKDVYHRSGWVMLDDSEAGNLADRIRKNFRESGRDDPTADITVDEIKRRWGGTLSGMDTEGFQTPYVNPSAGWCDAAMAVELLMKEAVAKGVRYDVGEAAELLLESDRVKGVKTRDGGVYTADKVLLATGAWTSSLMSPVEDQLGIAEDDRAEKQGTAACFCVAHFNLEEKEAELYRQMPVLVYGSKGEVFPPNRYGVWKFTNAGATTNYVTTPTGHRITVPPDRDQTVVPDKLKKESVDVIRSRIPQVLEKGRQPDSFRLCWDLVTPDQNQLLTRHPDPRLSNLYFAIGGSGHSWKFLPNIGKYVVNVLKGVSNGQERDERWAWKTDRDAGVRSRGAHEKAVPRRELNELE